MSDDSTALHKAKSRRWITLTGVVLALMLASGFVWWRFTHGPLPFDEAIWDASGFPGDKSFSRHRMADGLIESRALVGKSREDALAMLGEPSDADFGEHWNIVFRLGQCRHIVGIDTEFLAVHIDDAGKIAEAQIVED